MNYYEGEFKKDYDRVVKLVQNLQAKYPIYYQDIYLSVPTYFKLALQTQNNELVDDPNPVTRFYGAKIKYNCKDSAIAYIDPEQSPYVSIYSEIELSRPDNYVIKKLKIDLNNN